MTFFTLFRIWDPLLPHLPPPLPPIPSQFPNSPRERESWMIALLSLVSLSFSPISHLGLVQFFVFPTRETIHSVLVNPTCWIQCIYTHHHRLFLLLLLSMKSTARPCVGCTITKIWLKKKRPPRDKRKLRHFRFAFSQTRKGCQV